MRRLGCLCILISCMLVLVYASDYRDDIFGRDKANQEGAKAINEKNGFNFPFILFGGLLSMLTSVTPFVVHWSTGSNPNALKIVYTNTDFIKTGMATLAWLSFSLCQLHGANGKIVGAPAVAIYSAGLIIYGTSLVFKWSPSGVMSDAVCHTTMLSMLLIVILLLDVGVFGHLKREHKIANTISALATLTQVASSLLPYGDLCKGCICQDQAPDAKVPRIRNRRKLVVYIRSLEAGFTLYWAGCCIYRYDHTYFRIANITSVILSCIASYISIFEALKPVLGDNDEEALKTVI
ncbi:hypothetical protein OsI_03116 [Oryza sativa Indica Group]|uniref:Uncharacterized protein n=1 Tax=Oryza sativa subsp. indica TaxID=39946 RepID=A2WTD0_ORYSI|nr:hypothetical protein OsI_03116 [Oryza sativa Indica Group]